MEDTKQTAIDLAIIHTLLLPLGMWILMSIKWASVYLVSMTILHLARFIINKNNGNGVFDLRTRVFFLFLKGMGFTVLVIFSLQQAIKILAWLIVFYG